MNLDDDFFMVWCPMSGRTTYRHTSMKSAQVEAKRLANENPGSVFHVLRNMGHAKKVDVEWMPADDGIPF